MEFVLAPPWPSFGENLAFLSKNKAIGRNSSGQTAEIFLSKHSSDLRNSFLLGIFFPSEFEKFSAIVPYAANLFKKSPSNIKTRENGEKGKTNSEYNQLIGAIFQGLSISSIYT